MGERDSIVWREREILLYEGRERERNKLERNLPHNASHCVCASSVHLVFGT